MGVRSTTTMSPSPSMTSSSPTSRSQIYTKSPKHYRQQPSIVNERKNFDYVYANDCVTQVIQKASSFHDTSPNKPSTTSDTPRTTMTSMYPPQSSSQMDYFNTFSSPFQTPGGISSPSGGFMSHTMTPSAAGNTPMNGIGGMTGQLPSSTFLKYFSSPPSEKNSPVPLSDRLVSKGRKVTRTVDALKSIHIADIAAIDDWISNLKRLLFLHLYETLKRLDEGIRLIKLELYSRGVSLELITAVENILLFKSDV